MKSTKKVKKADGVLKIKTGTVEDFFKTAGNVMRSADKGERIKKQVKTLTFVDPTELAHYLTKTKIALIHRIRLHPDSIKNLAKDTHRSITAITSDVNELEKVGIVRSHSVINPGHGRLRIIELNASILKIEASI